MTASVSLRMVYSTSRVARKNVATPSCSTTRAAALGGQRPGTACQLAKSQITRGQEATQSFRSKLSELSDWIENHGFGFLRKNVEFGQTLESASNFSASHRDLFNQAHLKMFELEGLRGASKTISDKSSISEIEQIISQLSNQVASLKSRLDVRISVSERIVKFYKLYGQMDNEMSQIEHNIFEQNSGSNNFSSTFEESRLLIQQLYLQVSGSLTRAL